MQPTLPLYITQKGATAFELGIIISLLSFVAIAAKIPLGILAEHVGRWPIIPVVAFGQTVSLLLYSTATNVAWFYPIRIFHALILATFAPTAISITLDLAPQSKRGETMGKFLTSIGVATTFGPFLCSFLINYVDYVNLFRLTSVIPLLGLAPFLLVHRESSHVLPSEKRNLSFLVFLKENASQQNMLVLGYLRLAFSFTNAFFITLFALYAENNLLLVPSLIALLFGVKGITNMLSRLPSGKLVDKIGYRWPISLAFIMFSLTHLTISKTENIYLLVLAMAVYGLAHGIRAVTEWFLLGDLTQSRTRNIATSYLSTIFDAGAALGAIVAGALSIILNIQTIFKLASLITLTGFLAVTLIKTGDQFKPERASVRSSLRDTELGDLCFQ